MNDEEFKRQYARLCGAFNGTQGDRPVEHYETWLDRFGLWACSDFAEAVDLVIDNHQSMASDKWPTIGDFNKIVNQQERSEHPDTNEPSDDNYKEFRRVQQLIWGMPRDKRNELTDRAVAAVDKDEVPSFMKGVWQWGYLKRPAVRSMEVRLFCEDRGIKYPLQ